MQTFFNMNPKFGSLIFFSDSIEPEGPILLSICGFDTSFHASPSPPSKNNFDTLTLLTSDPLDQRKRIFKGNDGRHFWELTFTAWCIS